MKLHSTQIHFIPKIPEAIHSFYYTQIAIRLQLLENTNHYQAWQRHERSVSPSRIYLSRPSDLTFYIKKQISNCFLHSTCLLLFPPPKKGVFPSCLSQFRLKQSKYEELWKVREELDITWGGNCNKILKKCLKFDPEKQNRLKRSR